MDIFLSKWTYQTCKISYSIYNIYKVGKFKENIELSDGSIWFAASHNRLFCSHIN